MQRKYHIKDKETIYKYNNDIIHNRMATISYSMQLILYNEKEQNLINDIELKSQSKSNATERKIQYIHK